MKLVEEHISRQWNDGLIIGFISKINTERELLKCAPGTFLIRFSDSQKGKVLME